MLGKSEATWAIAQFSSRELGTADSTHEEACDVYAHLCSD